MGKHCEYSIQLARNKLAAGTCLILEKNMEVLHVGG